MIRVIPGIAAVAIASSVLTATQPIVIDLSKERAGHASGRFLSVVGDWLIANDEGGKPVLQVDGRQWIKGQPSAGLAAKARTLYGAKQEEFIDSVKAYAYFPYSVAKDVPGFTNGDIAMRFRLLGGQLDQCAGILFNLKANGDYLAVRFNGKEDNLVLWTFKQGKRSFVKKGVHDVPLKLGQWHRMKIAVSGTQLRGYLDEELLLEYTLAEPVSGKVGIWSKTDSVSQFDDYTVIAAEAPKAP
ncbi:MAG TPA: hypothetical protein VN605_15385 [Thermoanaerobaculia bacterium]|nr:hypothetical protein [Thermoanaerobaculia bacterium]